MSDNMAQRLEDIVEGAKERLLALDDAIREAVGDMPFGGHKMTPDQQMDSWIIGRGDPNYWQDMLQRSFEHHNLAPGPDPPLDVLEEDREMQKRLERRNSRERAVVVDGDL